jgi:hypothetical protein
MCDLLVKQNQGEEVQRVYKGNLPVEQASEPRRVQKECEGKEIDCR